MTIINYLKYKKVWNGGICPNCGQIYIYHSIEDNNIIFKCKCSDSSGEPIYHIFPKNIAYALYRFYVINNKIRACIEKLKEPDSEYIPGIENIKKQLNRLKNERLDILNNPRNKTWSNFIYNLVENNMEG